MKLSAVGAFVLVGFVLFGIALFMIGDRRRLFDESFEIHTEFAQLNGVGNGAPVRVAGIDAGEVVDIRYPGSPSEKFQVRLRIIEDLHPLIRTDSVASIQTDGLVGNKIIQIGSGTDAAPEVEPGATIRGQEPFQLQELMQRASNTFELLDETIEIVRTDVESALDSLGETLDDAGTILVDVGENVERVSEKTVAITEDVEGIFTNVREGRGSLGKLVTDDTLYERTTEIVAQVQRMSEDAAKTTENIKELSEEAKSMLGGVKGGGAGVAPGLMTDVRSTLSSAREAMGDMAESMESLKRGFLFRGMFLERGFFDLDSMTAEEYLEGGLRNKHHRDLRIWHSADELFEKNAAGEEVLSESGESALNASVRRILRYPPNSPLVVEGYSDTGERDEQFLAARSRAVLVRDYVRDKFYRDPSYTGFIALEGRDPELDEAGSGEGVVLALYYDNEAAPAPRNRIH